MKRISELRQDLVTGEWVVVATGRAHRPNEFAKRSPRIPPQTKRSCPFEVLFDGALLAYDAKGTEFSGRMIAKHRSTLASSWRVQVIPNKYPAFAQHGVCAVDHKVGPYHWQDGVGFHEVVVLRDHTKTIADMRGHEVLPLFRAYRDRYRTIEDDACVEYISIFHNHGFSAGASISHPHSQIIAIPVIPPDVGRSLRGSLEYFKREKACVHCVMLAFERKEKKRVVYENKRFTVVCPFVSRSAYEIRIFPRVHTSEFESSSDEDLAELSEAVVHALRAFKKTLKDPDYNFFIHTAPVSSSVSAKHYHWHIEIIPKTAIWAGFDIGTGIEISTTSPEDAARELRLSLR